MDEWILLALWCSRTYNCPESFLTMENLHTLVVAQQWHHSLIFPSSSLSSEVFKTPPPQYFKDLRRCKLFIVLPFQQSKMLQPVTLPLPQTVKAGVFTVVTVTKVYLSTVRFIWIGKLTLNNLSEYTVLAQRHGIIYQSKLNFKHNRQLCELFKKHMMEC